jgi:hypothetical protein
VSGSSSTVTFIPSSDRYGWDREYAYAVDAVRVKPTKVFPNGVVVSQTPDPRERTIPAGVDVHENRQFWCSKGCSLGDDMTLARSTQSPPNALRDTHPQPERLKNRRTTDFPSYRTSALGESVCFEHRVSPGNFVAPGRFHSEVVFEECRSFALSFGSSVQRKTHH